MDVKQLKNIYYSLVYSDISWDSTCTSDIRKLFVLQKKAVRIMTGSRYFQPHGELAGPLPSSDSFFEELDIFKIDDIYMLNVAKF